MKRDSIFPLLTAAALLLAAAAYAAVWLWEGAVHRRETAVCRSAVWEDSLSLSGAVLRRETVLSTSCAEVRLLCNEGERLPAGAPLAIVYDDPAEVFRALLLLRLREEAGLTEDPGRREARLADYAAALARGDLDRLPTAARGLSAAALESGAFSPDQLRAEADALTAAGAAHALYCAPESGFFSRLTDGLEALSPVHALTLSPRAFRERLEAAAEVEGVFGRLVTDNRWAFCAALPLSDAARFLPGEEVTLRLPDGGECSVRVQAVTEGDGEALLILESREALSRVLSLRRTSMTAVLGRWEGLVLPAGAVREEDGRCFVRRTVPLSADTPVTVLCRRGNEVLLVSDSLRAGMEVSLRPGE